MGITCKPLGKMKAMFHRIENETEKEKRELKRKAKEKKGK